MKGVDPKKVEKIIFSRMSEIDKTNFSDFDLQITHREKLPLPLEINVNYKYKCKENHILNAARENMTEEELAEYILERMATRTNWEIKTNKE